MATSFPCVDILYDSLCETFNPAYDILHTSFFLRNTYGFLIACEYETKRLGIYNFSCLSRRGAIGKGRTID